jgi:TetR/AcrR family transcriptional repressor of nem operon
MDTDLSPKAAEILVCTKSLLATGGYNGFSYADISAAVGITKASIHHHFPTKTDLVRTLIEQHRQQARAGMAALAERVPEPIAQLKAYTGYWAACIQDGTSTFCICAMLAAELPAIPAEVATEVQGYFRDLAAWLADVLARGAAAQALVLQSTPEAEAMAIMASVHGAMLSARAYGDPGVFVAIVDPAVDRLIAAA